MEFKGYLPLQFNANYSEVENSIEFSRYLDNCSITGVIVNDENMGMMYGTINGCLYSPIQDRIVVVDIYVPAMFGVSIPFYLHSDNIWRTQEVEFEPATEPVEFTKQWLNYACMYGFVDGQTAELNADQITAIERVIENKTMGMIFSRVDVETNYTGIQFYRVFSVYDERSSNDRYVITIEHRTTADLYYYYPNTHILEYHTN